jgi:HemY protein
MKFLFWLLALSAAAVAFVILGRIDTGYALFVWPPYRVEMSMLFFGIALLGVFLALYALFRLLSHAMALPAYVRAFRARRRRERAHEALAAALQAYYEGRYARAEKGPPTPSRAGRPPGSPRYLRPAHRTRCATSRAATAGSSAPRQRATARRRRAW